jgi:pimeloyl-ACP methyl ester carboxylesterase
MTTKTLSQVSVPGAKLHYEVSGSGPVLLLISGGGTDAAVYDGVRPQLSEHYTVVSYDPRGCSRSLYAGAPTDERVDQAAEDALAILDAIGAVEPAYVFGSSSGAITGMELIVRHPERIRLLVAHEPPAVELLPDATSAREFFLQVYETYREEGREAADRLFFGGIGVDEGEGKPALEDLPPEYREVMERMDANSDIFYEHKLLPFTSYRPDVAALADLEDQIVAAVGSESSKVLPAEPIIALADRLGWSVVAFPGGHGGYASDPYEFATLLLRVLAGKVA